MKKKLKCDGFIVFTLVYLKKSYIYFHIYFSDYYRLFKNSDNIY